MIGRYTGRQLSFQSDLLPAVSGIARLVANHSNGKYLAGVWWEDVAMGLCWQGVGHLERQDGCAGPSWSWASVIGRVSFLDEIFVRTLEEVSFKDYGMRHRGCNNFGQVRGGWIKVEAPLASFASISEAPDGMCLLSGLQYQNRYATAIFDFEEGKPEDLHLTFLMNHADERGQTVFGVVLRGVQDLSTVSEKVGSYSTLGMVSFA